MGSYNDFKRHTLALRNKIPSFRILSYSLALNQSQILIFDTQANSAYLFPANSLTDLPTSRKFKMLSNGLSGEARSKLDEIELADGLGEGVSLVGRLDRF